MPRSNYLVDIGLDMVRQRPGPSLSVLEGLLLGETSPRSAERRGIEQPALIVGHPNDPLHPFSDAGMLVEELPNASQVDADSILEWRTKPDRLNNELASFLDRVWADAEGEERAARKARMAGARHWLHARRRRSACARSASRRRSAKRQSSAGS